MASQKNSGKSKTHKIRTLCLTGGPGAGKTAVADVIKREFQGKVLVLPEAASLLYHGGFPRAESDEEVKRVQEAIYHVQRNAEALARVKKTRACLVVCDRGTLDSAAYFPGGLNKFLKEVGSDLKSELGRYDRVLHMETPGANMGYDFSNPVRTESSREALALDKRIQSVWGSHPNRFLVKSRESFLTKVTEVIEIIRSEIEQHG
jgi:predicted ATPase